VKNIRRQRTPEQYDFIESKVKQVWATRGPLSILEI
jgi:hypothetical protein